MKNLIKVTFVKLISAHIIHSDVFVREKALIVITVFIAARIDNEKAVVVPFVVTFSIII